MTLDLEVTEYRIIEDGVSLKDSSYLVKRYQPDGSVRWTISEYQNSRSVLSCQGEWIHEADLIQDKSLWADTRFETISQALNVFQAWSEAQRLTTDG